MLSIGRYTDLSFKNRSEASISLETSNIAVQKRAQSQDLLADGCFCRVERYKLVKTLNRRCLAVTVIAFAIMASNAGGQSYNRAALSPVNGLRLAPADSNAQYGQIKQIVSQLEYADSVGDDLVILVDGWRDAHGSPALVALKKDLARSRDACQNGDISDAQLAMIEEGIVQELGRNIKNEIGYRKDYFDLRDIIGAGKANCFGYAQVFYVLGNYLRLSVWAASVTPEHVANIVGLSDGTMTIVDLTRVDGFTSERINTGAEYGGNGSHWNFTDKGNLVRGDKTIRIWNRNEVAGEIYFCRGTTNYLSRQRSEAIAQYNKAIELNPRSAKAYNNRGGAYLTLGEHAKAISDFSRTLELDPGYTSAYHNRANAYLDSERYADAILDYTNTVERDARFTKAFFGRGFAHLASEHYAQAVSDYTRAIELDPGFSRAYYARAIGHAYLAENDEARRDLAQAVELDRTLAEDAKRISLEFDLDLNLD